MPRVLMFTPTQEKRQRDPFLEPVRQAHREVRGVTERLEDRNQHLPLGTAYNLALEYAQTHGFDFMLCIEDDEKPETDIVDRFLEATATISAGLYVGCKRLRAPNAPYVPFLWEFQHNPPAIGERPVRCRQLHPSDSPPVLVIFGGTVATPIFLRPAWFKEQGLQFRGGWGDRTGKYDRANDYSGPWDARLADDLWEKRLSYVAVPRVYVEHYNVDTREVLA